MDKVISYKYFAFLASLHKQNHSVKLWQDRIYLRLSSFFIAEVEVEAILNWCSMFTKNIKLLIIFYINKCET